MLLPPGAVLSIRQAVACTAPPVHLVWHPQTTKCQYLRPTRTKHRSPTTCCSAVLQLAWGQVVQSPHPPSRPKGPPALGPPHIPVPAAPAGSQRTLEEHGQGLPGPRLHRKHLGHSCRVMLCHCLLRTPMRAALQRVSSVQIKSRSLQQVGPCQSWVGTAAVIICRNMCWCRAQATAAQGCATLHF